ncbi:MAG: permease, partial [Candidatus Promineifilaceae bacterium]
MGPITKLCRLAHIHHHGPIAGVPPRPIGQLLFLRRAQNPHAAFGHDLPRTLARSFFSPEQARAALGGKREGVGNVLAAGLGVITPFCSCSAVPLFIGFVESGVPLGVTFSFLIATPVVNEIALAMLFGMFGWQIAGLYLVSGLTIAIIGG